jgi:hypothetical protein
VLGDEALYVEFDNYKIVIPYECLKGVRETKDGLIIADYFSYSLLTAKPPSEFVSELKARISGRKLPSELDQSHGTKT